MCIYGGVMFGLTMVVILKRKKNHTHIKKKTTHNQPYKIVMEMVIMERV